MFLISVWQKDTEDGPVCFEKKIKSVKPIVNGFEFEVRCILFEVFIFEL